MKYFLPRRMHRIKTNIRHFQYYWIAPIFPLKEILNLPRYYGRYLSSWHRYNRMPGAEALDFLDSYPQFFDATATTNYDSHYFYQSVWATERIVKSNVNFHVDVGSDMRFIGPLSTLLPVIFIDIRPAKTDLSTLTSTAGDILTLPFENNSITSLSCLHVVEHIGLGRYGDELNPAGTRLACAELARVLAPGGNLYFSLPVGQPRVCFNAHRIHSPLQILKYFHNLELVEFSVVTDTEAFYCGVNPEKFADSHYACGLFHFKKQKRQV